MGTFNIEVSHFQGLTEVIGPIQGREEARRSALVIAHLLKDNMNVEEVAVRDKSDDMQKLVLDFRGETKVTPYVTFAWDENWR